MAYQPVKCLNETRDSKDFGRYSNPSLVSNHTNLHQMSLMSASSNYGVASQGVLGVTSNGGCPPPQQSSLFPVQGGLHADGGSLALNAAAAANNYATMYNTQFYATYSDNPPVSFTRLFNTTNFSKFDPFAFQLATPSNSQSLHSMPAPSSTLFPSPTALKDRANNPNGHQFLTQPMLLTQRKSNHTDV